MENIWKMSYNLFILCFIMIELRALHMESNYKETFKIRILCIANELKLFNCGSFFKQFHYL